MHIKVNISAPMIIFASMQLSILFSFLEWVACGAGSIVLNRKNYCNMKGKKKGFPTLLQSAPFSDWALSVFCSQFCAAKPHGGWVSQQGFPDHCHGTHGYPLSPHTNSSGESPTLFWSATTIGHGKKDPSYMKFTVKNLYHFVTITSFSPITTLEI